MRDFAIYTVCTGHYKYGLFALVNSLLHFGYKGVIIVATDQRIPELEEVTQVEQVILESKHIFGNLKARIILENPSKTFLYLDPDVIQMHPDFLSIISNLLEESGRVILSAEGIVPKNEVRRFTWNNKVKIYSEPQSDTYYSAGFLAGIFSKHEALLRKWDAYIHEYIEPGKYFNCCPEFRLADQDLLNLVLQNMSPSEILGIGMPDWVGTATQRNSFHEYGLYESPLFVHATGGNKTWTIKTPPPRYPNYYDRYFYKFTFVDAIVKSDLKLSLYRKLWFSESKLLPFIHKFRSIM